MIDEKKYIYISFIEIQKNVFILLNSFSTRNKIYNFDI